MTKVKLKAGDVIHLNGIPFQLLGSVEVETSNENYKLLLSQKEHSALNPIHATSPDSVATSSMLRRLEPMDMALYDQAALDAAAAAERERCAAAVREVAEGYRSTKWGKAAECIGDACLDAICGV